MSVIIFLTHFEHQAQCHKDHPAIKDKINRLIAYLITFYIKHLGKGYVNVQNYKLLNPTTFLQTQI